MTFYRFLAVNLGDDGNRADYLEADVDWFTGVVGESDIGLGEWRAVLNSLPRDLRQGSELSEDGRVAASAIFYGDSRYLEANEEWFESRFFKMLLELGEMKESGQLRNIASEYRDLERLGEPDYSEPGDFAEWMRISDGLSHVDRAIVASLVTSFDWAEYICQELSVDYRREVFDRARSESVHLFSGEGIDDGIVSRALEQNIHWLDTLEERFGFDAPLPELLCRRMERIDGEGC